MLEVVHLTKIYKAKGGVETKALNDVSVRFPEKGMVFLLGKSGSGKSTLLNVCGGLDSPTSGEIIVKGRSSKNFSQSDFDSYRNTFIGFVFQEYNILNEFTVEDNIALALELQGKPKDKKAIRQLLDDVDLSSFAKRKPNTLSGGQKQRIAIARALIKHPEIIMADEPTGALDSATGKQVFDTLKKLSKTKLVIVVSHDRDFAEEYGDRIIELKDGKILSDVTKAEAAAKALGANLEIIGENTLSVKNGAALTQQDYQYIYSFLSRNQNAIISSGEKEISDFKKVSHITENGGKEYFAETDEKQIPKKQYDGKKTKFIRSKLPMRHAFRIGVSGLKSKPFRLIFTILLCSVAFIMFGLFSTLMLYDKNETLYQTLNDAGVSVLHVNKVYQVRYTYSYGDGDSYSGTEERPTRITEREVQTIAGTFGEAFGVYRFDGSISDMKTTELGNYYYFVLGYPSLNASKISYVSYLPETSALRSRIVCGAYPVNDDEICISTYTASAMIAAKKFETVADRNALLGKEISFDGDTSKTYKITGIFDSGDSLLEARYAEYKTKAVKNSSSKEELKNVQAMTTQIQDGYHQIAFFNEKTAENLRQSNSDNSGNKNYYDNFNSSYSATTTNDLSSYVNFQALSVLNAPDVVWAHGKSSVSDNEAVLSKAAFSKFMFSVKNNKDALVSDAYNYLFENGYAQYGDRISAWLSGTDTPSAEEQAAYDALVSFASAPEYAENLKYVKFFNKKITLFGDEQTAEQWFDSASQQSYDVFLPDGSYEKKDLDADQIRSVYSALLTAFDGEDIYLSSKVVMNYNSSVVESSAKQLRVVGICYDYDSYGFMLLSDNDYTTFKTISDENNPYGNTQTKRTEETKYTEPTDAKYDVVFLSYSSAHRNDLSMFSYEYGNDDSRFSIGNAEGQSLEMVNLIVEDLSKVFMWAGIALAAFSMLLLSNFIATSISYKKKEIGILRAVGARGADVFKIFYSESFVIALICLVLGIAGSVAGCNLINSEISETLNASIFVFGGTSALILLAIAAVTSAIATFLPVFTAAKKKPVEAIRAL